jgi:hypothetical protein
VAQTGCDAMNGHHIGAGAGAAAAFFLPLASPVEAEPIANATAATAINSAYPKVLSFIVSSQHC